LQPERLCVFGLSEARDASAAAVVLTTAADFHHVRLVSFLAVFAAVLAVLFGRTIARPVLAFVGDFVSHDRLLLIVDSILGGLVTTMLGAISLLVKTPIFSTNATTSEQY
jgi:hypothetical protein